MVGTLAKPYDLLLGRKTYDIFAGYWPKVPADNRIGPVFTKAHKYVLTSGSAKLEWANSHKLRNIDACERSRRARVRTLCCGAVQPSIRNCWKRISLTGYYCSPVQ